MNEVGHESANSSMSSGRDLPLLQDVDSNNDGQSDHWLGSWDAVYRDVVLVDSSNTWITSYNLTHNDLSQSANYNELREMLVDLALAEDDFSPWHNSVNALDVNSDSAISARDALLIINEINSAGSRKLATLPPGETPEFYLDTTGDQFVSARDALLVINQLKAQSTASSGVAAVADTSSSEHGLSIDVEMDRARMIALQDLFDDDDSKKVSAKT